MNYVPLSKLFYKNKIEYDAVIKQRSKRAEYRYTLPVAISGHQAFVMCTPEIIRLISDIYEKNSRLNAIAYSRDMPKMAIDDYINNALIEEIHQTNTIEGVHSTHKEIEDTLHNRDKRQGLRFAGMVDNYVSVLRYHRFSLNSSAELRKLYDRLLSDEIPMDNRPDGQLYRQGSVSVFNNLNGKLIHSGIEPEEKLIDFMDSSLQWLNNVNVALLIRVATFHYLLGYAHPFYDGNGRLSRFISSYFLRPVLGELVSLRVSYTIGQNKTKYYKAFDICNNVHNLGDVTPFVVTFLELLLEAENSLIEDLSYRAEKLSHYNGLINIEQHTGTQFDENKKRMMLDILYVLIQYSLFSETDPTLSMLQKTFAHVGKYKLTNALSDLVQRKLVTRNSRGRAYSYRVDLDEFEKQFGQPNA